MKDLKSHTIREFCRGVVECRICGLKFAPDLEEDREAHELQHMRIIWGAMPYDVREFIKLAAWGVLHDTRGPATEETKREQETAKRAIVFAWWARAVAKGIPENHLEAFMAAHLAHLDAELSCNQDQIDEAEELMAPWNKYG